MREAATIFGLSPAMAGGLFGLFVGIASFIALRLVAGQIETKEMREGGGSSKSPAAASALRWLALIDLFVFPAIGYYIGPLIAA